MTQLLKLELLLVPWLQTQPDVTAAIVFGSAVQQWPAAAGDIDLLLLAEPGCRRKQQLMLDGVRLDITRVDLPTMRQWTTQNVFKKKWLEILARAHLLWSSPAMQSTITELLNTTRQEWLAPHTATAEQLSQVVATIHRCMRKILASTQADLTYRYFCQLLLTELYHLLCYSTQLWPFDYVVDQQRHLEQQFPNFTAQWMAAWQLQNVTEQRQILCQLARRTLEQVQSINQTAAGIDHR